MQRTWMAMLKATGFLCLTAWIPVEAGPVVSDLWSGIKAVRVSGEYAYCAAEPGLMIYGVSEPGEPALVSRLFLEGSGSFKVAVADGYAYLLSGEVFLEKTVLNVVDVRNPGAPRLVSRYDDLTPSQAHDLLVSGKTCYVADANNVDILDVSRPERPVRIGRVKIADSPASVVALAMNEAALFAAWTGTESGGVQSIDVTDPSHPILKGRYLSDATVVSMSSIGSALYVASFPTALLVLNAENPERMELVRKIAYGATFLTSLFARDARLFVGAMEQGRSGELIAVYDASSPLAPKLLGKAWSRGTVLGMDLSGTHAFLPWWEATGGGLAVAEVEDDGVIAPIARVLAPSTSKVRLAADKVFATGSNSLRSMRLSGGNRVEAIGTLAFPQCVTRLEVEGHRAYLVTSGDSQPARPKLHIVDIADPFDMRLLRSISFEALLGQESTWYSTDFEVSGNKLYVPCIDGLSIHDASDPADLRRIGFLTTPDAADSVHVDGETAYLSTVHINPDTSMRRVDLYVVDVSDPASPRETSRLVGLIHADFTNDIRSCDGIIYQFVAGPGYGLGVVGEGRILVIDARDPVRPSHAGTVPTNPAKTGYAIEAFLSKNRIYVAEGLDGVSILNISNRTAPSFLRSVPTPGFTMGVAVDRKGRIHVADSSSYLVW